ncbi:MAG: hypothetical protein IKW92_07125 [Firmicutes bacterium]|nr:hypothetical protein [Bacillota bacterium]
MKHVPIKLGPLALLLAVIAICLTILAFLSVTTGQADLRLAQRYADTVTERYALEAEGQQFFADVCEGRAPEAGRAEISGTLGSAAQETGQLRLDYTLKRNAKGTYDIAAWKFIRDWEEDTELDNIWTGE